MASDLRHSLGRSTDALPLDIFRVLVGVVVFVYFLQTLLAARDFSAPDGLIDHELTQELFWFTRIGLFHPGLSLRFFQIVFLIACLCSVALIVGYRVKLCALVLYVLAVCTYRWNFLVMYVDDSVMHLSLFWVLVLPVGRTLVVKEWRADGKGAWERWKRARVPAFTVHCLLWNLALIYIVAGLWKWTSPMWRDGTALYVILRLPISLTPGFWGPQHLPFLKFLNYCALLLEPLFPLIFILPRGHRAKYALLIGLLGFHVGTLVTLNIPFANLACMAALVIPFGGELMDRVRGQTPARSASPSPLRLDFSGALALVCVSALTLAMISSAILPEWRTPPRNSVNENALAMRLGADGPMAIARFEYEGLGYLQWSFFAFLWCIGIAQQYQLFNWIDDRNYSFHYEVIAHQGDGSVRQVDPELMFPRTTRGVLLQLYLHGVTWMRIPSERQAELRSSLQLRFARRYCRQSQPEGDVAVYSTLERVTATKKNVEEDRILFMKFRCQPGEPHMQVMNLDP